jgi:predicted ester cyclase
MGKEENRALMRRFIEEFWNDRNLAVADELFTADAPAPSAPDLPPGPEGAKAAGNMIFSAFPDFHMEIDRMVATDDRVAVRSIQTGTHQGELMGLAPTNKAATWTEISVVRIEDGKIAESWWETDMLGLMQQLGAIPAATSS